MTQREANRKNLLEWLDEIPPFVCRMAALKSGKGRKTVRIPCAELIQKSGIKRRRFQYISHSISWKNVTVEDASRFAEACSVDLVKRGWLYQFYRVHVKGGLKYLNRSQKMRYDKLVSEWRKTQK